MWLIGIQLSEFTNGRKANTIKLPLIKRSVHKPIREEEHPVDNSRLKTSKE